MLQPRSAGSQWSWPSADGELLQTQVWGCAGGSPGLTMSARCHHLIQTSMIQGFWVWGVLFWGGGRGGRGAQDPGLSLINSTPTQGAAAPGFLVLRSVDGWAQGSCDSPCACSLLHGTFIIISLAWPARRRTPRRCNHLYAARQAHFSQHRSPLAGHVRQSSWITTKSRTGYWCCASWRRPAQLRKTFIDEEGAEGGGNDWRSWGHVDPGRHHFADNGKVGRHGIGRLLLEGQEDGGVL